MRSARPTATAEAVLAGGPPSQTQSLLFNPLFNSCVYITVVVILYRFVWFFLEEETTRLLLLRYPAPDPAPEAGPSSEERRLDRTSLMSTKRNLSKRAPVFQNIQILKYECLSSSLLACSSLDAGCSVHLVQPKQQVVRSFDLSTIGRTLVSTLTIYACAPPLFLFFVKFAAFLM